MKTFAAITAAALAASAHADIRITEWMYTGNGSAAEFVEITNVGNSAIDLTGWSYDDISRTPGSFSLSGAGLVAPGQSVIISEASAATFNAAWGLSGVTVLGVNTHNLGRGDEINIYDSSSMLVDRLTYDDQNIGGPRANAFSGNPMTDAALGANNVLQWQLASVGDMYGSWMSSEGDVANPGQYIPAPGAAAALAIAGLAASRRRR